MSGISGAALSSRRTSSDKNRGGAACLARSRICACSSLTLSGFLVGEVRFLRRVLRKIEKLDVRRQKSEPNQLPVSLAHCTAVRLDVVDDLVPRGGFPFADRRPHIDAIQRLFLAKLAPGERDKRRIHVDDVHHLVHDARPYPAGPIGERNDPGAAFIDRSLAVTVRPIVRRQLAERVPPLSLTKTMRVFSRIFRFSRASITLPISSSMAVIWAA